ncbi:MAG: dTDP-glucose 4,6-dehydratase [Chloroflexota bacterium]
MGLIPNTHRNLKDSYTVSQYHTLNGRGLTDFSQEEMIREKPPYQNFLVTGGAGFIGSNFVRYMLEKYTTCRIVVYDCLSYSGNLSTLRELSATYGERYTFIQGDICDEVQVGNALMQHEIDCIVNFAAETHVDRSLMDPGVFARTNVMGTCALLEQTRRYEIKRFHQISTDEVYGQILQGSFKETDNLRPRNPYSATKAGADSLCLAYFNSFDLPITISRGSNNIGPYQYPEKVVPLFVTNLLDELPIPVYGDGTYERDYLYVHDHCEAIDYILHLGQMGEVYNIGSGHETKNITLASTLCDLLCKPTSLIRLVDDRPGQDRRYSLDSSKLESLGWQPKHTLIDGLKASVTWYVENEWWWRPIKEGNFKVYFERQYKQRMAHAAPSPVA